MFEDGDASRRQDGLDIVPIMQVGFHEAAGELLEHGVKYVLHAVGPQWGVDNDAQTERGVETTVSRALATADLLGATSVMIPAISGGLFGRNEQDQLASRRALVKVALQWGSRAPRDATLTLTEIVLVRTPCAE